MAFHSGEDSLARIGSSLVPMAGQLLQDCSLARGAPCHATVDGSLPRGCVAGVLGSDFVNFQFFLSNLAARAPPGGPRRPKIGPQGRK